MDWADGEVVVTGNTHKLTVRQERALLEMMEVLRQNSVISSACGIKISLESGDMWNAKCYWEDLTQEEQNALWVAPTYGGVFTTHERKVIQEGFKDE